MGSDDKHGAALEEAQAAIKLYKSIVSEYPGTKSATKMMTTKNATTTTARPDTASRSSTGGGSSGSVSSSDQTGTGNSANPTNSSKNDGNHRSLSALSASSVLAHRFVPQNLLEINTRPVARILDTRQQLLEEVHDGTNTSSLEVETERVFFGLTAEHFPGPFCGCPNQACHQPPRATKVTEEPHHARRLASTRGSPHIPVSSMAGRDEYVNVFRECLQVEYEETRRLYERYNTYEATVELLKETPGVARISLPGIADARPALATGDVVLLRPHRAVVVDMPPGADQYANMAGPFYSPPPPLQQQQSHTCRLSKNGTTLIGKKKCVACLQQKQAYVRPPHMSRVTFKQEFVEIHSQVLSVVRGPGHRPDALYVSFVKEPTLAKRLTEHFCTLRFIPSTIVHERSLTALSWLETASHLAPLEAKELLFPSKIPDLPPTPAMNETGDDSAVEEAEYEQLNRSQARFVQMVLIRAENPTRQGLRPPLIVTGPAGTGKTKALLVALLQTLNRNTTTDAAETSTSKRLKRRILVCTPSHTACDVITRRLSSLLSRQGLPNDVLKKMIFRLYDMNRPVEMVPIDLLPFARQSGEGGQFSLPSTQELLGFSVVVCTCQDAHLLYLAGFTNASLRQRRQCLQARVERGLQAAGLQVPDEGISGSDDPHFTHLFIDEAAQATEPEGLIPMSVVVDFHPTATKVEIALCGDPRQLSPNIYSPLAQEGLQRSLLERLLRLPGITYGGGRDHLLGPPSADSWKTMDELIEYSFQKKDCHEHLSVFLNLSYRGHSSFLHIVSELFYFGKLRSAMNQRSAISDPREGQDEWIRATRNLESTSTLAYPESVTSKPMDWPLHFRGVVGHDKSAVVDTIFGSNSWSNEEEAKEVLEIVANLGKTGVKTSSIGVMALFRAQVVLTRKLLRGRGLGAVNVGTVENYQAVESDVVVLSLTRSDRKLLRVDKTRQAGIFFQPKRMNVALTRAEKLLIVVGNPNIMAMDPAWKTWLDYVRGNGLWYGAKMRGS